MTYINKEFNIDDNRLIKCNFNYGYEGIVNVNDIFLEDNHILKRVRYSRYGDFEMAASIDVPYDELFDYHEVSFDYYPGNPLYIPLLHLLNDDNVLVLEDDNTEEYNQKYMSINKFGERITVIFVNNKEDDASFERFSVFIKNVLPDFRSKVGCNGLDTKERLNRFFKELYQLTMEEYHQMTIEEYLLTKPKVRIKK